MRVSTLPLNVDVDETGRILGCGRSMVFSLIASGELQSFKVGRRRMVTGASLAAYVTNHADGAHAQEPA